MHEITQVLDAIGRGEPRAAGELLPLVYEELRGIAARDLANERPGQTLNATALVHEAYLRIAGEGGDSAWANRRHFFAAAAEAMRRIPVESARRKGRIKHGGGRRREAADLDALDGGHAPDDVLDLHEALERLAQAHPQKAKLVELRFFGGLTLEEAADTLEISLSSADRGWRFDRAWLYDAMAEADRENSSAG